MSTSFKTKFNPIRILLCLSLLVVFALLPYTSRAQALIDAIQLSKFVTPQGALLTNNDSVYSILSRYVPDSSKLNKDLIELEFEGNPFISFTNGIRSAGTPVRAKFLSAVGGADVTQLADGLARFIVQRLEEEVSITFFMDFKEAFSTHQELRILFPASASVANHIESYRYSYLLSALKEAFEKDLNGLFANVPGLTQLPQYANLKDTKHGKLFLTLASLVDQLLSKNNPAEIISSIAQKNYILEDSAYFSNCLKLTFLISESLRDTSSNKTWISLQAVNTRNLSTSTINLYLGLMYQTDKRVNVQFGRHTFRKFLEGLKNKSEKTTDFLQAWISRLHDLEKLMKSVNEENYGENRNSTLYIKAFFALLSKAGNEGWLLDLPTPLSDRETFSFVLSKAADLYADINSERYSSALFDMLAILDRTIWKNIESGLKDRTIKYGTFIASIAEANSSEDVKNAIELFALPPGSSRIKKDSRFNVAINAFLGGFAGQEYLRKQAAGHHWNPTYGITAPIGVAASWGLGKKGGSFSVFTSFIDLGAVTSFRFQNDSTEVLPKLTLQNIIAPGIGIVYGLPNYPVSIGANVQLGPQLRKITINDRTVESSAWRWGITATVDLPLFNLYTKSR